MECPDWLTTVLGSLEVSDGIALVSAAAAAVAAWQASKSAGVSRRMYALAVTEHLRAEPALDLSLIDAGLNHVRTENRRIYLFRLLVTNRSIVANSIKRVFLSIEFGTPGQPLSNITITHDATAAEATAAAATEHNVFAMPASIAPGETLSGIALFPLKEDLLQGAAVESYTVSITDGYDRNASCEAILLRETGL